ncbi:hypothetical protein [Steroidobacter flavus]|uniref:hypothetical protein n=1 Tax=Steroidobacter flavus TaxID=1842136 RepID=UPI0036D41AD5
MAEQPVAARAELYAGVFTAADAGFTERLQIERRRVLRESKHFAIETQAAQAGGAAVDVLAIAVFGDQPFWVALGRSTNPAL